MSGVAKVGPEVNECHVIACEVMGMDCEQNNVKLENVTKEELLDPRLFKVPGTDPGSLDLTEQDLARINAVMKEYDCGLKGIMSKHENAGLLRVLHRDGLFDGCPKVSQRRRFSWMSREIQKVVDNGEHKKIRM